MNITSPLFRSLSGRYRCCAAICSALGIGFAGISVAQAAPADGDATLYTFQRSAKAGDIGRYKLAMKVTINADPEFKNPQFSINLRYKEVAKNVKDDGTVVLADTTEDAQLKNDQAEQDITAIVPVVTQSLDKQGKIVSVVAEGGNIPTAVGASSFLIAVVQTQSAFYPSKPVKVGDTWKMETGPIKVNEQSVKSSSTATFLGTESLNKINTVKVKVVQDSDVTGKVPQKLHFEGTGNIDPRDGTFVKLVGVIDGKTAAIKKSEFTLTRVLGEDTAETKTDAKADSGAKSVVPVKQ